MTSLSGWILMNQISLATQRTTSIPTEPIRWETMILANLGQKMNRKMNQQRGGWKMTGQQGPRLSFMDQYQVLMLSWVQMRTSWIFFLLFFQALLFELMVNQTNLYARQRQQTRPDPRWTPVTGEEMKAWLGMQVAMSILQLPQTAMYWSTDSLFGNIPITKVMTRDRFDEISQYFHLNDSTQNLPRDNSGWDKIYHVRLIHDPMLDRCLTTYNAHQNVSIDEAMIKFRGRLAFCQYMQAKPTKYGIKVWMRSDPTNGYTNEFQIYTGEVEGRREVGLAERVVCDLANME